MPLATSRRNSPRRSRRRSKEVRPMVSPTNCFMTDIATTLKHRGEKDAQVSLDSNRSIVQMDYQRDRLTKEDWKALMNDLAEIERHFGWETPEMWRSTAASAH